MRLRRVLIVLLVATGAAVAAHVLTTSTLFERLFGQLEMETLDVRMQNAATPLDAEELSNPHADSAEIAILLFDSTSVKDWPYLSPFPRAFLAELVDAVAGLGARAIGLDVYLDRLYPTLSSLDDGDARLRESIRRAGNVILAAGTDGTSELRVLRPPHPFFAEVAAGVATADLATSFETVRDVVLTVRTEQGLVPGFSLALFAHARGLDLDSLLAAARRRGDLALPALPARHARLPERVASQTVPILFTGPPSRPERQDGAFRAYSAGLIRELGPFTPAEWFRDKVVLIGSGFHAEDRFRTPFYKATTPEGDEYGWMYGIEVHANALDNLLSGRHPVPLDAGRAFALLLVLALLVSLATFLRGVSWGAASATTLLAAAFALAWIAFDRSHVHLPVIGPTIAIALAFLGSTSYVSVVEGRDKRMIRGIFSKYVSPAIVRELVADPGRVKLGGEKRAVTLLFSDLAGFTSLSESLSPEALVALLNQYLDEMSDIVLDEAGTLDKYIGDAIMALYGAPDSHPEHALRACRTALRMQRRLAELNRSWREAGAPWPSLSMRIGINTGTPVVGNIGGEKRFDYTALGDAVNLAARLEPACKTYGVQIMIAQPTREAAGDAILVRELDLLAVYGKAEPVRVYELVGLAGQELGARAAPLEQYADGLAAYRRRDFELALQYFQAAAELDPADRPTLLYLDRCRDYIANPPPADWDAVERRQVK